MTMMTVVMVRKWLGRIHTWSESTVRTIWVSTVGVSTTQWTIRIEASEIATSKNLVRSAESDSSGIFTRFSYRTEVSMTQGILSKECIFISPELGYYTHSLR